MVRFDAYSATTLAAKPGELFTLLADSVPAFHRSKMVEGRGFHTFGQRRAFKGEDGTEFASLQWGGQQGERCMIEVKGEHTPAVVEALRASVPHRCTRVDSCADFDAPKAFQRLYRGCRAVKRAHRVMGGKAGDWEDFPEKGRTLYLGAQSSATRVRLYEKGLQPEYAHLGLRDWCRLEIQVRPAKDAKDEFSKLGPLDVWGASRWTRDLAAELLREHVDPHPAGTVHRRTDDEAALHWMVKQYGPMLARLRDEVGSWDCVGLTIGEVLREQQEGRARGGEGLQ